MLPEPVARAVTRAGGPVVTGTRFLAVAEVYSPVREVDGDPPTDNGKIEQDVSTPEEEVGSHPLEHSGVENWAGTSNGSLEISPLEDPGGITKSDPIHKLVGWEPLERPVSSVTLCWDNEPAIDDVQEEPEEWEAIVVGAVGSAAPWFLTGWTNDVEVEFMIDTGCQVTILATSVFEKMCAADSQVRSKIRPCACRLVSADSSPLTVIGELELDVVFPGLKCTMCCVVASIGSDGLLGTEALQSCLPHQLDLRTGQLWAEGRATLQLHQQKPNPDINGLLLTAVVLPPDSEVVAPFALNGGQLGTCGLIEPNWDLTEEFVLLCMTCIGKLVPISAVSVARSELKLPADGVVLLPEYLEDIVKGSHPSLGETGRRSLRDLLHRYEHVFPAPGEPVTGRTKSVQHEIITKDARPIRCEPRRLAPAGLRTEQQCVKDMLTGGQIEPSDSPWASPVVLVMKKDGLTRFCVDYCRLNALTTKDAYPLPRIDDSLRLLGNQQWFSTMDLASVYWQVAMSPEAKQKAAFVTNEGLFQFRVMPFGLCNAPAMFERLMDRVLCGMRWSRCLVYLDDVISFGKSIPEALPEEVLARLSEFGLQL